MEFIQYVSRPPKALRSKAHQNIRDYLKDLTQLPPTTNKNNNSFEASSFARSNSFRVRSTSRSTIGASFCIDAVLPTQRNEIHIRRNNDNNKENSVQNVQRSNIMRPLKRMIGSREDFSQKRIELVDYKARLTFPAPKVTARCWSIFEVNSCKLIWGSKCQTQREVASLTKIVTLMTALKLCKEMDIDASVTFARVSANASRVLGTTASLKAGQYVSLQDLYYAIMLVSGNDAAVVLAECLGALHHLHQSSSMVTEFINDATKREQLNQLQMSVSQPITYFVGEMNRLTRDLSVTNSVWCNPHGLNNKYNKSSAYDMARLTCKAMSDPHFAAIVATKQHKAVVSSPKSGLEELTWTNTNKLLEEGWDGCKTGITPNAGPCLSACVTLSLPDTKEQIQLVVVVLGSLSQEHRWSECRMLVEWASRVFQ